MSRTMLLLAGLFVVMFVVGCGTSAEPDSSQTDCAWQEAIVGRWHNSAGWGTSDGASGDSSEWSFFASGTVIVEQFDQGASVRFFYDNWKCDGGLLVYGRMGGTWEVTISGKTLQLLMPNTVIGPTMTRLEGG